MSAAAPIAVVSGSGLDLTALLDTTSQTRSFADFSNLPATTVPGHAGCFHFGRCGARDVILQRGRLHVSEGHSIATVQSTVHVLQTLGAGTIVFTNAAGGLRPEMQVGDLVGITSALLWPFAEWADAPETISPALTLEGCDHGGTYIWVHGPNYETPDEIRLMRKLGGAAVGMSTAPELVKCRELGINAAAVSCITNNCCVPQKLNHAHVMKAARSASDRLVGLLRRFIQTGPLQSAQ